MIARGKKQSWKLAKKLHPLSKAQMRGGRLTVESWSGPPSDGGVLLKRSIGPTRAALLRDHAYGRCMGYYCSFCYAEAERYAKEHPDEINWKPSLQV